MDKKGNPFKSFRDLHSDWTAEKGVSRFGLKEHASVDTSHGFLFVTGIIPASHHDSPHLRLCVPGSYHTEEPIKKVYAGKGCFGEPTVRFSP